MEDKKRMGRICIVVEVGSGGMFQCPVQDLVGGHSRARLEMSGKGLGIGIWGEMMVREVRALLWTVW